MNGNPFFVDPTMGAEAIPGQLAGISSILNENRMRQQEMQEKKAAEEKAIARQQAAIEAARGAFSSGNPDAIAEASLNYPEISQQLKESVGIRSESQAKEAANFLREFAMGNEGNRRQILERRIADVEARGGDASDSRQSLADYMENPESESRQLINFWAATGDEGYKAYSDERKAEAKAAEADAKAAAEESRFVRGEAGKNARAARNAMPGTNGKPTAGMQDFQYYQQLKKDDPASAEAFGRERGFISKEGQELSGHLQKRLSTSTDDGIKAERNAAEFLSLADQIEASELKGGILGGTVGETIKDITGSQDAVTELKKRAQQVRASQVMANLPPGAASDPDVAMAKQPMPSDNASKNQWASWLRGVSKLEQYNADFNNFKAEYISDTGNERGMLKAWKDRGAAPAAESSGEWEIVE